MADSGLEEAASITVVSWFSTTIEIGGARSGIPALAESVADTGILAVEGGDVAADDGIGTWVIISSQSVSLG